MLIFCILVTQIIGISSILREKYTQINGIQETKILIVLFQVILNTVNLKMKFNHHNHAI